jgi:ribosomal protein L32E
MDYYRLTVNDSWRRSRGESYVYRQRSERLPDVELTFCPERGKRATSNGAFCEVLAYFSALVNVADVNGL